jgi:hypothetical protein
MKQHYLFATAAIFVTQLAIAQANKTETKKDHPSRPARTEQTLKVDRSVSENNQLEKLKNLLLDSHKQIILETLER